MLIQMSLVKDLNNMTTERLDSYERALRSFIKDLRDSIEDVRLELARVENRFNEIYK